MTDDTRRRAAASSEDPAWTPLFAAWLVAGSATLAALFLSEVMQVTPCVLCWYQRIFMFSLAVVLSLALFPLDRQVTRYALPLAALGWLFALFHQLVVIGLIPDRLTPCTQGIPCSEQSLVWFGFVTIPTLSLLAFSVLLFLLIVTRLRGSP